MANAKQQLAGAASDETRARTVLVKRIARECGFELAGVARAVPVPEAEGFRQWVKAGYAGEMQYLTDHRAEVRLDPERLLAGARSLICVGKLYNTTEAAALADTGPERGLISRYAWGEDYHAWMRRGLERIVERLQEALGEFGFKICVDTAPLLETAYAHHAGLGWIGKNTCLIHEQLGSWFFLGEVVTTLDLEPDEPPPDRCGTCTRCVDAGPTGAIVPATGPGDSAYTVDARRCISYLTIELRGSVPERQREQIGNHVFGCDICQEVCPWNRAAPVTGAVSPVPEAVAPPLENLASLTPKEFRRLYGQTPIARSRYHGFLRNVAIAMGNSGNVRFRTPLEKLAENSDPVVAEHARWALERLGEGE